MSATNRYLFYTATVMFLVLAETITPVMAQTQFRAGESANKNLDAGGRSTAFIVSQVNAAGFSDVYFIGFEHGLYSIKVRHPVGHNVEVQLDPESGALVKDPKTGKPRYKAISSSKPDKSVPFWKDLITQVRAAGYPEVYSIEYEHALYEIIAMDARNQVVELWANPNTGKLLRHPATGEPLSERVE